MTNLELAYVVIETDQVEAVGSMLTDIVGFAPGNEIDGTRSFRNDDRESRIVLQPGPSNDVTAMGIDAGTIETMSAVVDRLRSLGYRVTESTESERDQRQVGTMFHTVAPWGVPIELVTDQRPASAPLDTPLVPGGFLTNGVGFGHCVFFVNDLEAAHHFAVDGLGFEQTDSLGFEVAPGVEVSGRFYHCNPRHHTMALVQPPMPPPFKLHHIMVEVNDRDDVGAAFDRAYAAGTQIANGLGKHPNDHMFSCYLQSPINFQVEVGFGGRLVGADWNEDIKYDRISAWGHQPVVRAS
jgi:biphenyl-2,3-diol 1,2-dioxygenase